VRIETPTKVEGQEEKMSVWQEFRKWADDNNTAIRLLVWAVLLIWAVVATIAANLPAGTYQVKDVVHFPPQTTHLMSGKCKGKDPALFWQVTSSNPSQSAIYTTEATALKEENTQVGFSLTAMNAAGSSNPRRPDVDFTLTVTREKVQFPFLRDLLTSFKSKLIST
jgi:hypothetical protein